MGALTTDVGTDVSVLMLVVAHVAIPNTLLEAISNAVHLVSDLDIGDIALPCGANNPLHPLCGCCPCLSLLGTVQMLSCGQIWPQLIIVLAQCMRQHKLEHFGPELEVPQLGP